MQAETAPLTIRIAIIASGRIFPCCAIVADIIGPATNTKLTNMTTPMTSHIHDNTTVKVQAQRRAQSEPIPSQTNATANRR